MKAEKAGGGFPERSFRFAVRGSASFRRCPSSSAFLQLLRYRPAGDFSQSRIILQPFRRMPPVILIIRDGWGINPHGPLQAEQDGDATVLAHTPFHDHLLAAYPHGRLSASGLDVGLPEGQMGKFGGRPPQPRRGPHRLPGPDPHRQSHRRGAAGGEPGDQGGVRQGVRTRPAAAFHGSGQRRRRPQPPRPPRRPGQNRPRRRRAGNPHPRVHRRPGHLADRRRRLSRNPRRRARGHRRADRHGDRPLLRHGPRPPLGTHQARLGRHRLRQGHGLRARSHRRGYPSVRRWDDGRVFAADDLPAARRRRAAGQRRRRGVLLQLPLRPRQAALGGVPGRGFRRLRARALAARALRHAHAVRRQLRLPARFPAADDGENPRAGRLGGRQAAAAHRRNGKVPARHLFFQRRGGNAVPGARSAASSRRRRWPRTISSRR